MNSRLRCLILCGTLLLAALAPSNVTCAEPSSESAPDIMLDLPATGQDPSQIDFFALPKLPGEHVVISQGDDDWQFRLHEYLAFFDDRFWCIWSHGPVIEDRATQHIRYATSEDGLHWSEPQVLVGPPEGNYGYIARGLWIREGELLALASYFEAPGFSGGDLRLDAFRWNRAKLAWEPAGMVQDDTLNNFPPQQLPDGRWMMSRRDTKRDVSFMLGGASSISDWEIIPFVRYDAAPGQRPEEPNWYLLPDGERIAGMFRNNSKGQRLLRAFSEDGGRTWSKLRETNFPDARSKFHSVRTSRGYFALVSNPNPAGRNPLCLSTSPDGVVYTAMARLPIPGPQKDSLQYPHALEHGDHLWIVYSRNKRGVELMRIPLAEVDALAESR